MLLSQLQLGSRAALFELEQILCLIPIELELKPAAWNAMKARSTVW